MTAMDYEGPEVAALLARGRWSPCTSFTRLSGGSRHRVYLLREGERAAVLKLYGDPGIAAREPFEHETVVHGFLAEHAPSSVPQILDLDAAARSIVFEWIDGKRPSGREINAATVRRMAEFITLLNRPEVRADARTRGLPLASDAAFGFAGHWAKAWSRLQSLLQSSPHAPLDDAMKRFVSSELVPALREIEDMNDRELEPREHALSPSDFGFHNVLVRPDGTLVFLDFEHAGWDDPAKLAADFFLQPECPLDENLQHEFLAAVAASGLFPEDLEQRVVRMLPLQAVKWTAVILNVFQAAPDSTSRSALEARLHKAEAYWHRRGATSAVGR